MKVGRFWRTVRHLKTEQAAYAVIRRARHAYWRHCPERARQRITAAAREMPLPDPTSAALQRIAPQVHRLQQTVHGEQKDMPDGSFRFLGRTVEFGAVDAIDWRRDLGEESSPLWRLTLAYLGWAVPLVAGDPQALSSVAAAVRRLDIDHAWSAPGVFRDLWNPYTASHRLINILTAVALCRGAGARPSESEAALLEHARFCAAHVTADLEYDLHLNHLLKNYVALAIFAATLPAVPRQLAFIEQAVPRLLDQVILPDGGHAERSPMYHALGLQDLRLLREAGVFSHTWQPMLDRQVAAMEAALAHLTHPDGDIALFSDSWLGGSPAPRELGIAPVQAGSHRLRDMGYVRLEGRGEAIVLDCGPIGPDFNPAHGHADYLAVEASMAGQRLIVDFGTPTYVADPLREASRSAAVHNGPRLVGNEPAELWKSFRVGRRAQAGFLEGPGLDQAPLWAAGWQDGYRRAGCEVSRWVGLWPGLGFIIADLWQGQKAQAVSDFLLPEPWQVHLGQAARVVEGPISVEILTAAGQIDVQAGERWWPRYGEAAPATRLRLRPDKGGFAAVGFFRQEVAKPDAAAVVEALREALPRARQSTASPV